MYDQSNATAAAAITTATHTITGASITHSNKRSAAHLVDPEYHQVLLNRSSKRRRNDFDRYIEIPNDPDIASSLHWWRHNDQQFSDLGRMARDVLPVPASGCAVERQFSISGRITVWQRNRLSSRVISDSMIYKAALSHTRCPLLVELDHIDDVDQLPIEEKDGTIPDEWVTGWWLKKLERGLPSAPITNMMGPSVDEDDEDLYG